MTALTTTLHYSLPQILYSFSDPSSSAEDEEEEEVVHMGNAIMSFYSALIDLLGRCAPEMHVSHMEDIWR